MKEKWNDLRSPIIPVIFFILQLFTSMLNELMIIQTPSELITESNSYLEFILLHALRPAISEEFLYRFIVLGIFMLYFLDKLSEDSRGIKEVILDGIALAKLGVRFPYRFNKEYIYDIAKTISFQ